MAQGTYIGQAQINMQAEDKEYVVGDVVTWKSDVSVHYLVTRIDIENNKVTVVPFSEAFKGNIDWFTKAIE